jgi:phytoene dehydrogenase-like protein
MKKVIIIGSGIGGLTAGNLLAKRGHKVTIFESHSSPGGYTAGFYRKGFYFESGTLSFESSSSIFKAMKDIGVLDKISFVIQKSRSVSQDFDSILGSYLDFKQMYYNAFPSEKDKLEKYFSEVDEMYDATRPFGQKPIPFLYSGLRFVFAIVPFLFSGRKFMKISKRYKRITIGEFTARFFAKDSKLYRLLTGVGYPEMGAWIVGGAMTVFDDYWTVYGGMQSWADILSDNFKKSGGELRLNSYVDTILTKNGKAVGVSSKNVTFDADYIISACDYKKTLLKLPDNKSLVPVELQEKIRKASVSESFFTVYLGLSISNDELRKYMKIPYVIYRDEKPGKDLHNTKDENFFEKTSITLYSPSMMNPDLAPKGKSSLMLQAFSPPGWMQNWGCGDKEKYSQLKGKVKKSLIKKGEGIVPDLRNHVEYEDAATPLTYERYTHNTDGASSAWSWNPKKKFFTNTMRFNIETPITNLYIGSCWATQIGGVPGAVTAAYLCSKKIK